jgi:preprotein translocase subunit SecY
MWKTITTAWNIIELRKKILVTLGLFLLFRLGTHLTLPGIQRAVLHLWTDQGGFMGLLDLFSGGATFNISLLALSVGPYITSSIIMQLLGGVIPALEKLVKEGGLEGQRKIAQITKWVTVGLAALQGAGFIWGIYPQMMASTGIQIPLFINDSVWLKIYMLFILVVGAYMIVWLGEIMTEHGIGNGVSLIIFAGIISRIVPGFIEVFQNIGISVTVVGFIVSLAIVILVIAGITWAYEAERRIPIQYAKRIVGRKMVGGQATYMPLRMVQSGVLPIIFASSFIQFPVVLGIFFPAGHWWHTTLVPAITSYTSIWYNVAFFLLIVAFTYFWTAFQYDPKKISEDLKESGGFIPGVRPGEATENYFKHVLAKITLPASIFIAALAIVPNLVLRGNTTLANMFIGGTGILIVIGVAIETVNQIESFMTMRNYEGFLRK